jgi:hypothetical protein
MEEKGARSEGAGQQQREQWSSAPKTEKINAMETINNSI